MMRVAVSTSSTTKRANSVWVMSMGSAPYRASASRTVGVASVAETSLAILAIVLDGVPAGAHNPYQIGYS